MRNLVKMTRSAYSTARSNRTLVCPNVALITDENNKVEYLKNNPTSDIGIASWESGVRKFYSLAEWNALETKPTALGVYVFTEQAQFIIHDGSVGGQWSDINTYLVPGVTTYANGNTALLDFAGKTNSQAVLDAVAAGDLGSAAIFTAARNLTSADNAVYYIPALGELNLIFTNLTEINNCRTAIGHTTISFGTYNVSSTQKDASTPWTLGNTGVPGGAIKGYSGYGSWAICSI